MSRTNTEFLNQVEFFSSPFRHFIATQVFERSKALKLLRWLQYEVRWKMADYNVYTCYLSDMNIPEDCKWLFDKDTIVQIRNKVQSIFELDFGDKFHIVAQKMTLGQRIEIHTDNPLDGKETHRLIVYFNESYDDKQGGHLVCFNSNNVKDIAKIFRPLFNLGVGMELSAKSYHAVSTVHESERYSIVFSFWNKP